MKVWLIWIVAVAICAVPVGWLATRNLRAVPVGALVVAFILIGYFGALGIAGGGYNPATRPAESAKSLTVILTVIAVLAVLSVVVMNGALPLRAVWIVVSTVVWFVVALVLYGAMLQVQQVHSDVANEAYLAPRRALEQEIVQRRAALDAAPAGRRPVLDSALAWLTNDVARRYEKLERVVMFGDPATAPGQVVVWGVLTMRPDSPWERWGFEAKELHWQLNQRLREAGYPARVALGFAPTADVTQAGGDAAYFGPDGRRVAPQFEPDAPAEGFPRPFPAPRRTN